MADITGVHAAGWHELLQEWWQFVSYDLFPGQHCHSRFLGTRRFYPRLCGLGNDVCIVPGMLKPV